MNSQVHLNIQACVIHYVQNVWNVSEVCIHKNSLSIHHASIWQPSTSEVLLLFLFLTICSRWTILQKRRPITTGPRNQFYKFKGTISPTVWVYHDGKCCYTVKIRQTIFTLWLTRWPQCLDWSETTRISVRCPWNLPQCLKGLCNICSKFRAPEFSSWRKQFKGSPPFLDQFNEGLRECDVEIRAHGSIL